MHVLGDEPPDRLLGRASSAMRPDGPNRALRWGLAVHTPGRVKFLEALTPWTVPQRPCRAQRRGLGSLLHQDFGC